LVLRLLLSFTKNTFTVNGSANPTAFSQSTITQNVTQATGAFTLQIIYNFYNTDKFKVFAGTGISANISAYPTNKYSVNYSGISSGERNNFPELTSLWFSAPVTAGIMLNKKLEIFGAYHLPLTIVTSNYQNFSASIIAYSAGLNYFIGSNHHK
jgi:hypothetical protein